MSTQLWQAYQSVSAILNLTLVPYGNAKVSTSSLYIYVLLTEIHNLD